jgi:hypothetical protein
MGLRHHDAGRVPTQDLVQPRTSDDAMSLRAAELGAFPSLRVPIVQVRVGFRLTHPTALNALPGI